jgi:hypothetical protein
MAKKIDLLKAKQKKQKILAAVLGVVFLAVMGFQVPRVLKMMKTPPPPHANDGPTATTAAPPAGTPSLAAPSLSGAEQPGATPASATSTPDTAAALQGQLASFSRFASKDPFSQQLSEDSDSSTSGSSASSGSGKGGTSAPQVPSSSPQPGSAVISVNGTLYTVAKGSDFPQATSADPAAVPLFHLVSVTGTTAKISIVGGSYSSGAATVTLRVNKPVTLMNTADGTRYTLVLKPLGTAVPSGGTSVDAGSGSGSGSGSTPSGTTTTSTTPTTVTLPGP